MMSKFELNPNGYVAKMLTWHYGADGKARQNYLSKPHNGCAMFWRFIFLFFWSLGGLRSPPLPKKYKLGVYSKEDIERSYKTKLHWEKVDKRARARREKYPWLEYFSFWAVLTLATSFFLGMLLYMGFQFGSERFGLSNVPLATIVGTGALLGILSLIGGCLWLVGFLLKSEPTRLLNLWLKSKKEKVCPIVTFG